MNQLSSMSQAPSQGISAMPSSSAPRGYVYPPDPVESGDRPEVKAYRRSRSGCFTCRLRRKKCDEERPTCKSCTKLGLRCDYKTPQWWATNEQRRRQRDRIKDRIRQTKVMEKEGSLKEYMDRIKAMCQKSTADTQFEVSNPLLTEESTTNPYAEPLPTPVTASTATPAMPFSFDYNNSENGGAWATMAATNTYSTTAFIPGNPLQPQQPTPELSSEEWYKNSATPMTANSFFQPQSQPQPQPRPQPQPQPLSTVGMDSLGLGYGSSQGTLSSCLQSMVPINESDRPLLDHFVDIVLPLVFPVAEVARTGPLRVREIVNSLKTNRSYMHCCLSVAAIHLKTSMGMADEMDHDIVKHRYEAICQLTKALNRSSAQMEVMDVTLAMIFYHCSVGTADDYLPDIPWNAHFRAVSNLVRKLHCAPSRLNVSLIAWIDILGATMLGETPQFAHTYRTKHLRGVSSGLQVLMGCDDRVMYLISEIACLESLKIEGQLDDMTVCHHVTALTAQLDWTEPLEPTLEAPFTPAGIVRPDMLAKIVTTLFRIATRIYLHSLLPGSNPYDPTVSGLVAAVTDTLKYIPAGAHGFDRALVWPLFMAGAYSIPSSLFRKTMADRVTALGYLGDFGSFGRMYRVLKEIWRVADGSPSSPVTASASSSSSSATVATTAGASSSGFDQPSLSIPQPTSPQPHWREIMKRNNWNYLMM